MKNQLIIFSLTILLFGLFGFSKFPKSNTLAEFKRSAKVLKSPLEAILVVGNTQESTKSSISQMDSLALIFIKNGVKVTKFYGNNTNWESIKTAAKTASFFVYAGHGSNLGINGVTGGLCLKEFIYTKQILEELRFRKNALVLFKSVCGGAGSSADDIKDIGIEEAAKRVADYSQPFFSVGASCYYADNFVGGVDLFLTEFFKGNCIAECYKSTTGFGIVNPEYNKPFIFDNKKQICVSAHKSNGIATVTSYVNGKKTVKKILPFKEYDIALVGNPSFSIKDLKIN
ncbi:MAG: hypothetical protein ACOYBS_02675 [Flavobacterium sp.]